MNESQSLTPYGMLLGRSVHKKIEQTSNFN